MVNVFMAQKIACIEPVEKRHTVLLHEYTVCRHVCVCYLRHFTAEAVCMMTRLSIPMSPQHIVKQCVCDITHISVFYCFPSV